MTELSLTIEAGQAFGSGEHPTTQGMLQMMQQVSGEGAAPRSVLDVGCGSGVLTVLAAMLWPEARLVATDINPSAPAQVKRNLLLNDVDASHVAVFQADMVRHPAIEQYAPYDLIVSNILSQPLFELAADIVPLLNDGGRIMLGGILVWREAQLCEAYRAAGCDIESVSAQGQWRTILVKH